MPTILFSHSLLGDALMQTPAIRALKKKYPEQVLSYLHSAERPAWELLLGNPYLAEVDTYPHAELEERAGELGTPLKFEAWDAHVKASERGCTIQEGFGYLAGLTPPEMDGLHYDYAMTEAEREEGLQSVSLWGEGKPVVIIARHSASCSSNDPRVGHPNKCLPNRFWVQVANWLLKEGFCPVAVGAESDAQDTRYFDWPGKKCYGMSLRSMMGMLAASHAVLAVDTGIRHMAAAVGANLCTYSGAIPLTHIRLEPRPDCPGQKIEEVFRPLPFWTARQMVDQAKLVL